MKLGSFPLSEANLTTAGSRLFAIYPLWVIGRRADEDL
jgi:hypothetical protein